jgi:DNA repair exonuclease SbcCD ATPase subunit
MILRVRGQNFLPFRDPFEFRLDNQGLIVVRGDNRISAAANDNGSGKTSILHAIAWATWGEDLRGRKADAVANRFTEGLCYVTIDHVDAAGEWGYTRSRRSAGLAAYGLNLPADSNMDVIQAAIDARIGYGLRTFKNAVVFGQGAFDRFAHADQAEQMRMLDEIQGIDFTDARKRTKAWRDKVVTQHGEIVSTISTATTALERAREEVRTLTALRDSYEEQKNVTLRSLNDRLALSQNEASRIEGELKGLDSKAELLGRLRVEDNKCIDLDGALSLARQDEQNKGRIQDEAGRELRRFDEALEALLGKGVCPECRAKVDDVPRIKERFAKDRAALARASERATREYKKSLGVTAAALQTLEDAQEVRAKVAGIDPSPFGSDQDASSIIARLEVESSPVAAMRLRSALLKAQQSIVALNEEMGRTALKVWDGAKALDAAETNVVALTARIAREQGRRERASVAVSMADYATEAFSDRGIRSMLADGVAGYLNERMAEHLTVLTAGEAKNVMSSQTTLKKGGTRERISFTPTWAWGGDGADTGSDGQDRRVDLSTFAAVQDLSESRSARPFPFKAYDEPFDALDSRGKAMACAWLRAQAKERTVLLITHSEELAALAEPDQTWTIVHDENGARILLL